MGLTKWNTALRSSNYPPESITEALEYSFSPSIQHAFDAAESITRDAVERHRTNWFTLPQWCISWPGGQLAGIGRNGMFADNIDRFEKAFGLRGVVFRVDLKRLQSAESLHEVLFTVIEHISTRSNRQNQGSNLGIPNSFLDEYVKGAIPVKRNPGAKCLDESKEPTEEQLGILAEFFQEKKTSVIRESDVLSPSDEASF